MVFGVETGRVVRGRGRTRIGFAKEQCFQFGVKELWRGEVFLEPVICVRYLSQSWREFIPKRRDS